jgi:hypothetical protein
MTSSRYRIAVLFALGLVLGSTDSEEIYRWVDEKGNVHFGDTPPPDSQLETIEVEPLPSDQAVQEAKDRVQRLQEKEKESPESRQEGGLLEDREPTEQPAVDLPTGASCFAFLEDSWAGRITDTREQVIRKTLSDNELRRIRSLFRALEGRPGGTMEEITCVGPDPEPSVITHYFRIDLHAQWQPDEIFQIEANLIGGRETRAVLREFYHFLLSRDGLRFRKRGAGGWFDLDQPGNDVETLTVRNDVLTFFWRQGGRVRRANVFSLQKTGRGFTISEFFYVQGMLSGTRVWEIGR